jgi:hypothetical protein
LRHRSNEIRSQPSLFAANPSGYLPREAATRRFAFIKARLCRRRLSHLTPSYGHAGAGVTRSRAMSIRISANIYRDTATSASWKVT